MKIFVIRDKYGKPFTVLNTEREAREFLQWKCGNSTLGRHDYNYEVMDIK